jgi:hypothetical protein
MTNEPLSFPAIEAAPLIQGDQTGHTNSWHTDPARLPFLDYRDRLMWGPPNAQGSRALINKKLVLESFWYTVRQKDNEYANGEDPKFGTWETVLDAGRSYLAGSDTPMPEFLRRHSSSLTTWQKQAYQWCLANPSRCLVFESRPLRRNYEIKKRGEYIEIGLPHHDWGGERHWVTRDGKRKVLVNVD